MQQSINLHAIPRPNSETLPSSTRRCVQPARNHQMRGWGFTKKLEPIMWLSPLLGRGRSGRANLIGGLPRCRERAVQVGAAKQRAESRGKRGEGRRGGRELQAPFQRDETSLPGPAPSSPAPSSYLTPHTIHSLPFARTCSELKRPLGGHCGHLSSRKPNPLQTSTSLGCRDLSPAI